MLLGIDHVVIAWPDLHEATELLRETIGLEASGGGRHDALGTENRLVWLGDSYLELMTVFDPALAAQSWFGRPALGALSRGGGLSTYALATDDLAADLAGLRAIGSHLGDPDPGQRRRPDSETVRWRLSRLPTLGPDQPPFLIEHEMSGPEWGAAARDARLAQVHTFGGTARLRRLEIAVPDPAGLAARYWSELGVKFAPPGSSILDASIGPVPSNREADGASSQSIRLLPAGHDRPAACIIVTMSSGRPRKVDVLGCRFVLEPAED